MDSILNVDDYAPGRYARTKILQQAGFMVREAATGQEALQAAAEHKPALILLDVNLPDMSGLDVCRMIRRDPKTFATTILHISASNVQTHQQVEGLDGGADSYLVEPVDPTVLIATVRAFLRARQAEEALRRSNEELEWFGHRVAHDLSEPLRTVTAHTQWLEMKLRPGLDKATSESLQFVVEAAKRMQLLIDGLLRYAQVSHVRAEAKTIDCETMLAELTANLEAAIQASGARITHGPLPEIVADPGLEQVFQNLISNAIKYRREGVAPEIHISAKREGTAWIFSVQDNGIGVEPQHIKSIFQIFHRLHGEEVPGSGIGLALSKKIVEAHGGSIWIESDPGVGSTFFFRLPKEPPAALLPATVEEGPGRVES